MKTPVCRCVADEEDLRGLQARAQEMALGMTVALSAQGMCDLAQREFLVAIFMVWLRNICMDEEPTQVLEKTIQRIRDEYSDLLDRAVVTRMDESGRLVPIDKKGMN
jgi:hypothetical protein